MNAKKPAPAIVRAPTALALLGAASLLQVPPDAATQKLLARVDEARGRSTKPLDTLVVEGTLELRFDEAGSEPIATGTFLETWAGRATFRGTNTLSNVADQERGLADGVVWEIEPNAGARVHDGKEAAALVRYAALLRGAPASDLYRAIANDGTRDLDGTPHIVLRMTPPQGEPDTWWIEPDSARVTRIDLELPTPQDCVLVFGFPEWSKSQLRFGDWKRVDGAELPHRRVLRMGSMEIAMTCTKVERGVTIEPGRLKLPEAVVKAAARRASAGDSPYEILERPQQPTAAIRLRCKASELNSTQAILFPEVIGAVMEQGAKMAGLPFTLYHGEQGDQLDIEVGIPIVKGFEDKGRVKASELPGGRTVMTWHFGPYEQLRAAHEQLLRHADEEGLTPRGGSWETYWTDPGMVPDPAKWRTQLFLPIE